MYIIPFKVRLTVRVQYRKVHSIPHGIFIRRIQAFPPRATSNFSLNFRRILNLFHLFHSILSTTQLSELYSLSVRKKTFWKAKIILGYSLLASRVVVEFNIFKTFFSPTIQFSNCRPSQYTQYTTIIIIIIYAWKMEI